MSSKPLPPLVVVINSETKPESNNKYPSNGYESVLVIENQAGMPEFQHGVIDPTPLPPVGDDINHNVLNNNSEFLLKKRCAKTDFLVS